MTLSISQVAARSGLRPSALRYYEELGLIRSAGRRSGRRQFDPDILSRLAFIALAQDVGFTLDEVSAFLRGRPRGRERWRALARGKIDELEQRLQRVQEMVRMLETALACSCDPMEDTCELMEAAAARRRGRADNKRQGGDTTDAFVLGLVPRQMKRALIARESAGDPGG